jgi:hypothetical protein
LVLGIFTSGFTVLDRFFPKSNKHPVINIRAEPIILHVDSSSYPTDVGVAVDIETSNGAYKILRNLFIDSIHIEAPSYFHDSSYKPIAQIREVILDKLILDSKVPEIIGLLKFQINYIPNGHLVGGMANNTQILLATIFLTFPYEFENKNYFEELGIPLILKH